MNNNKCPIRSQSAQAAGLSILTAAKVSDHRPDVIPEALERVWKSIRELGYDHHRFPKTVPPKGTTVNMPVITMGGVSDQLLMKPIAEG